MDTSTPADDTTVTDPQDKTARHRKSGNTDPSLYKKVDFDGLLAGKPDARPTSEITHAFKTFANEVPSRSQNRTRVPIGLIIITLIIIGIIVGGVLSVLEMLSRLSEHPWS